MNCRLKYIRRTTLWAVLGIFYTGTDIPFVFALDENKVSGKRSEQREDLQKIYSLNIQPQPLSTTLTQFSHITGIQTLYESKLVEGKTCPAIKIKATAKDLLGHLLKEFSLSYEFVDANAVVIVRGRTTSVSPVNADEAHEIEEVLVTGFRQSLKNAIQIKRSHSQIIDVVAYEDFGKLPDNNVAEAMQRVTGIQIERDQVGDGSGFQVRGLTQNRVSVNGASLVSNNNANRSISFNAVPSAFYKNIKIIKSASADMIEGGIGASVELETFLPSDFKEDYYGSSFSFISDSDQISSDNYQFNQIASKTFEHSKLGKIGVLANLYKQVRQTDNERIRIFWAQIKESQLELLDDFPDYSVFQPGRVHLNDLNFDVDNLSLDLISQWHAKKNLSFTAQLTLIERQDFKQQSRLRIRGESPSLLLFDDYTLVDFTRRAERAIYIDDAGLERVPVVQRGILSAGRFTTAHGAEIARINGEHSKDTNEIKLINISSEWQINNNITMQSRLVFSESKQNRDALYTNYTIFNDYAIFNDAAIGPEFIFDFYSENKLPSINVDFEKFNIERKNLELPSLSLTEKSSFNLNEIGGADIDNSARQYSLTSDFDWHIDESYDLEFGIRLSRLSSSKFESEIHDGSDNLRLAEPNWARTSIFSPDWINGDSDPTNNVQSPQTRVDLVEQGLLADFFNVSESDLVFNNLSGDIARNWLVVRHTNPALWTEILNQYFPGRQQRLCSAACSGPDGVDGTGDDGILQTYIPAWHWRVDDTAEFQLRENIYAAYVKLNFNSWLWQLPWSGNIGLRAIATNYNGEGFDGILSEKINGKNNYQNYLPSFTSTLELNTELYLKFAAAKTMSRPSPLTITPSTIATNDRSRRTLGNPSLKPYEASQSDLSIEWYPNDRFAVSASLFYKNLYHFIDSSSIQSQVMDDLDGDGFSGSEGDVATITFYHNGKKGQVYGYELSYFQEFDFLPQPFDKTGINWNYTHSRSDNKNGINELNGEHLPTERLSEDSLNLILFYEYSRFGFRLAYNYRDQFLIGRTAPMSDRQLYISDPLVNSSANQFQPIEVQLPIWQSSHGQIDLSAYYKTSYCTFYFQMRDIHSEPRTAYIQNPELLRDWRSASSQYLLGIKAIF